MIVVNLISAEPFSQLDRHALLTVMPQIASRKGHLEMVELRRGYHLP